MKRKSIATETIMKIFIMIAVILVASSFLLKAFKIDILEFLQGKLGGLGIPSSAKALHVVIDSNEGEIWEFHLTDGETADTYKEVFGTYLQVKKVHTVNIGQGSEEGFFILDNAPPDKCLLFITEENDGIGTYHEDNAYIYYINQGTTIQDGCGGNIKGCISGRIAWEGCRNLLREYKVVDSKVEFDGNFVYIGYCLPGDCPVKNDLTRSEYCWYGETTRPINSSYFISYYLRGCPSSTPPGYIMCETSKGVVDMPFTDRQEYSWLFRCDDYQKSKSPNPYCNLLVPTDSTYKIKYGLICAKGDKTDEAKWYACTEKAEKAGDNRGGKTCKVENGIGRWQEF